MKRTIAGMVLLIGLGAGTLFAEDNYRHDRRGVNRDEASVSNERRESRREVYDGYYAAAPRERREARSQDRDRDRDRREIQWDRR